MRFKLIETNIIKFDTQDERFRIKTAFEDDPETQFKLNELMDTIEQQNWEAAKNLIESEWWLNSDDTGPRLEYIGSYEFGKSYINLIYTMTNASSTSIIEKDNDNTSYLWSVEGLGCGNKWHIEYSASSQDEAQYVLNRLVASNYRKRSELRIKKIGR